MKSKKVLILIFCILTAITMSACDTKSKESTNEDIAGTCMLYVECKNAVNYKGLQKNIVEVLPQDGIVFGEKEVKFYKDDSAYDVLERELKSAKVAIEGTRTPGLGSVYIEGIGNLYEFDCGETSGWMYSVNGEFQSVSSSEYKVQDNDKIEFRYSCNLGKDLGANTEY